MIFSFASASVISSVSPVWSSVTKTFFVSEIGMRGSVTGGASVMLTVLRGIEIRSVPNAAGSDTKEISGFSAATADNNRDCRLADDSAGAPPGTGFARYSAICLRVFRVPTISGDTAGRSGIFSSRVDRISTRLIESIPSSASMSISSPSISGG